jgi:hypothetical protein
MDLGVFTICGFWWFGIKKKGKLPRASVGKTKWSHDEVPK